MSQNIRRYKKTQILQGTAYIQEQFFEEVQKTSKTYRLFQLSDVVVGKSNDLVKGRYQIDEMIETYFIVNSSPILRRLVALYNKIFNVISIG